jgi:hypothetical protein
MQDDQPIHQAPQARAKARPILATAASSSSSSAVQTATIAAANAAAAEAAAASQLSDPPTLEFYMSKLHRELRDSCRARSLTMSGTMEILSNRLMASDRFLIGESLSSTSEALSSYGRILAQFARRDGSDIPTQAQIDLVRVVARRKNVPIPEHLFVSSRMNGEFIEEQSRFE